MAASLQYLTVQDVLWINQEATRRTNRFHYATLEEATYYQYAYGESKTLLPQAARFLLGFLKLRPFDAGNAATAFIGTLAFLRANGVCVSLEDGEGVRWFDRANANPDAARAGVGEIVESREAHPEAPYAEEPHENRGVGMGMRGWVQGVFVDFPETVAALVARGN